MNLITQLRQYAGDLLHLFYPHTCMGCGSDVLEQSETICAHCMSGLPDTGYFRFPGNPVEQLFAGRILVQEAGSTFHFTKKSVMQNLVHGLKYGGGTDAGLFLGKQTGIAIQQSGRFTDIDLIIPLPLSERRQQERGYNQSFLIAQGIASVLGKPVAGHVALHRLHTATQTGKDRTSRWHAMEHAFSITPGKAAGLQNRHILLVDDIVTTGATLEACGELILSIPGVKLSIATAAHTI